MFLDFMKMLYPCKLRDKKVASPDGLMTEHLRREEESIMI